MSSVRKFLVVDHNPESCALLARGLFRKFPEALVEQCQDAQTACLTLRTEHIDAVILHRTDELDAAALSKMLRSVSTDVPILAMSGIDRTREVLSAGASAFMNSDEWLRTGTVISELMEARLVAVGSRA